VILQGWAGANRVAAAGHQLQNLRTVERAGMEGAGELQSAQMS
jgi:hypothetical protein